MLGTGSFFLQKSIRDGVMGVVSQGESRMGEMHHVVAQTLRMHIAIQTLGGHRGGGERNGCSACDWPRGGGASNRLKRAEDTGEARAAAGD